MAYAINKSEFNAIIKYNHFEKLKTKYKVMSVPCLVVNDTEVYFGKKNINQLLDLISWQKSPSGLLYLLYEICYNFAR